MNNDYGMILAEQCIEEMIVNEKIRSVSGAIGKSIGLGVFSLIPYVGLLSVLVTPVWGNMVEKRVNRFKYQCEAIRDPVKQHQCQLKMMSFMIKTLETSIKKAGNIPPKQRDRSYKALEKYREAYTKFAGKEFHQESTAKEIMEAATGGWWKTLLGGIAIQGIAANRINKLYYHCNQLKDDPVRFNKCKLQVIEQLESLLKPHAGEPKIDKRLVHLAKIKAQAKEKIAKGYK